MKNEDVYSFLAHIYQRRWKSFLKHQRLVLQPLIRVLPQDHRHRVTILDIGCGVGLDLFILQEAGFRVEGMDTSDNMIRFAKKNVPAARIRRGDVIHTKLPTEGYDAIVLDAFIHLFPKKDVPRLLRRIGRSLKPGGYLFVFTTRSRKSSEGMEVKRGYPGAMKRYRAHWTKREFLSLLRSKTTRIVSYAENTDPRRSFTWMTVMVQKIGT